MAQIYQGPIESGAQIGSGTISAIAAFYIQVHSVLLNRNEF